MAMLALSTGLSKLLLIFLIYQFGTGNASDSDNVSFCGGHGGDGTLTTEIPLATARAESVSLSEVSQRLVIKCQYIADTTKNLKSQYAVNKIQDSSLLALLHSSSRLTGFPPNPTETTVNATLLHNFEGLQKILAFVRLAKKNEFSLVYKRGISTIMNQVKGILCELSILLKSRGIPVERIQVRMPSSYKTMSQTSRYSWLYILLRDVLGFFEESVHLYQSYS